MEIASSSGLPPGTAPRPRVLWLQNNVEHYFSAMLDELNQKATIEYVAAFLCPEPQPQDRWPVPRNAHYVFLGKARRPGASTPAPLKSDAKAILSSLAFDAAIVGGYDRSLKLWLMRECNRTHRPCLLFADSNIRSERGQRFRRRLKRFLKRLYLRRVINRVDRVLPCNRYGVGYWRYYGVPRTRIVRTSYYCNTEILSRAAASPRASIMEKYGLDPARKYLFTAARLAPEKALHLMIEAFGRSGLEEKGWTWVIAGRGPLAQALAAQAGERNRRSIRFLGFVEPSDIPVLARHSAIFVLPSIYEPHGIVVAEAMGVGTPVVAANICGAAGDLVSPEKTGWIFTTGSVPSLTAVLQRATAAPASLEAMRPVCRRHFESWYARFGPVQVIHPLLEQLLNITGP